jgi:hypothetical protein
MSDEQVLKEGEKFSVTWRLHLVDCLDKAGIPNYAIGYILSNGDSVINYNYPPDHGNKNSPFSNLRHLAAAMGADKETVFEYRGSTLILTTLDASSRKGKIIAPAAIPVLGSEVISFSEYTTGMKRVFNLPGYFSKKRVTSSDLDTINNKTGKYYLSEFHQSLLCSQIESLPEKYTGKRLVDKFGEHIAFGLIQDDGSFLVDLSKGIVRDPELLKSSRLPPNLFEKRSKEDYVYEFRSERLILGKLTGTSFIPEVGSKVVSYVDYGSKKLPPYRIYNLPSKYKK